MNSILVYCINGIILSGQLLSNVDADFSEINIKPSSRSDVAFVINKSFINKIYFEDGSICTYNSELSDNRFMSFEDKNVIVRVKGGMSYSGVVEHEYSEGIDIMPFGDINIVIRIPVNEIEKVFRI